MKYKFEKIKIMRKAIIPILMLIGSYTGFAQIVNIPDANFKNALVNTNCVDTFGNWLPDIDADFNNDGEIQVSEALAIDNLHLNNNNIISLEGLQSFSNLEILYCSYNDVITMDVSQNPNLEILHCYDNELTSVNVTQNPFLLDFLCQNNNLTNIDVSQNSNLIQLSVSSNYLTSINVNNNTNLITLLVRSNELTSLDVSQNENLQELTCSFNSILSLDISNLPLIYDLDCRYNSLTSLNIKNGNNIDLIFMDADENPDLTCIQVDDVAIAKSQSAWEKDGWAEYSEECILGIAQVEQFDIALYPNPVQNVLKINSDIVFDSIKIYSLGGSILSEVSDFNEIDVSKLNTGTYFAQVSLKDQSIFKMFIKK
jgi:hypothetical protein